MGLSDDERLLKTYRAVAEWRQLLRRLHAVVAPTALYAGGESPQRLVRRWIGLLDELMGRLIATSERSSTYWLLGANEHDYRSLFASPYELARAQPVADAPERSPESGSLDWWLEASSLVSTAEHLAPYAIGHEEHTLTKRLAYWWHQWRYVAATLYPVLRYDDPLFQPIGRRLLRLLGEMGNLRYAVVGHGTQPLDEEDAEFYAELLRRENALLNKHQLVSHFLAQADLAAERRRVKPKARRTDQFDMGAIYARVAALTLSEVVELVKQLTEAAYTRQLQSAAPAASPPDGIMGPSPRPAAELERLIETSDDPTVIRRAAAELEHVYGCYYGGVEQRLQELERRPAQSKAKAKAKAKAKVKTKAKTKAKTKTPAACK
jgi:hypothetical protein